MSTNFWEIDNDPDGDEDDETTNTNPAAGSFFHKVPDEQEGNEKNIAATNYNDPNRSENEAFEFNLKKALDLRQKPSLAQQESTIQGVPTKGFGKQSGAKQKQPANKSAKQKDTNDSSSSYIEISNSINNLPQIKLQSNAVNDPTKPEIDDQGYTIYTDETTGAKSRVFEALIEYPCEFKIKIVGANEGPFVADMVELVAGHTNVHDSSNIKHSITNVKSGKWVSVTIMAPVQSSQMLYELYEIIDRDPRVKFKF